MTVAATAGTPAGDPNCGVAFSTIATPFHVASCLNAMAAGDGNRAGPLPPAISLDTDDDVWTRRGEDVSLVNGTTAAKRVGMGVWIDTAIGLD